MAIKAEVYGRAVCKALDIDPNNVRRVVIDATTGDVLRVYIDYYGGPSLLEIQLPTSDVEVKVLNGKADNGHG